MQKMFISKSSKETQKLGKILAEELKNGGIIALEGELGSGKTTFTQGFLSGLELGGPYTSPTFVVIKRYRRKIKKAKAELGNAYHIDAYRVCSKDMSNLGWEEIISNPENIVIIEWANRIKKLIPAKAIWIKFEWIDNNTRKIKLYENRIK
jgi:tRNA threonylcarbamoyladenosine biosynthesis protein TsaE